MNIFPTKVFSFRIFLEKIVCKFYYCYKQNWAIMVENCASSWVLYRKIVIFQVYSDNLLSIWNDITVECDHYIATSTAPFMITPPKIWLFKISRYIFFQIYWKLNSEIALWWENDRFTSGQVLMNQMMKTNRNNKKKEVIQSNVTSTMCSTFNSETSSIQTYQNIEK